MTQYATVTEVLDKGLVRVIVARKSACGHDCEHCGGCGAQGGSVEVQAKTALPVEPGDKVELYSGGRKVLGAAALVYLTPVVLFLLGYMIPSWLTEGLRYACGGAGFLLGILCAVAYDRYMRCHDRISYEILRKL